LKPYKRTEYTPPNQKGGFILSSNHFIRSCTNNHVSRPCYHAQLAKLFTCTITECGSGDISWQNGFAVSASMSMMKK